MRSQGAAEDRGAGAGEGSERLRAPSRSPRARAAVAAAALLRIPLRGLRPVLGKRLRSALVASGDSQPVLGEYAARLDPAHLGLGSLRVGGVGEWTERGSRAPFRGARGEAESAPVGIRELHLWVLTSPHPQTRRSAPGELQEQMRSPPPLSTFPARRKAPLAGVAPRSPGMRAREPQFCQTAEAPEVTTNFFALGGSCCVAREGPRGKGAWRREPG